MQKIFQLLLFTMLLSLFGCTAFHVYQPDMEQGNVLSTEQISQLKLGMSKGEVKYLLGTPLLQNTFDSNRWYYVYTMNKRGKIIEKKRLSLTFSNDKLVAIK